MNVAEETKDAVWDVVARVRDEYNRASDDAPTDAIVDALAKADLLREEVEQ